MAANTKTSRKAARYAVPVAVAGIAAATVAMVPAFANAGGPDLPEVTAQQLIEKVAASDVQQLTGTARLSTDLGLPTLASGLLGGGGVAGGSADPQDKVAQLANGTHTFRVAADGPDRQKLTFLDGKDEYTLVHNGTDVWGYDSKSNEAFHEKADGKDGGKDAGKGKEHPKTADRLAASPQQMAQDLIKQAGPTTDIGVGDTAQVAGRDAYQLVLKPKQSGSTVGSVRIAVDAKNGVPLRVQLLSSQGGKPIAEAGFTQVDFAKPGADAFSFTPPKGAKVTEGADKAAGKGGEHGKEFGPLEAFPGLDALTGGADGKGGKGDVKVLGEGWATVARIDTGAGKNLSDIEKDKNAPKEAKQFLNSLGDKVTGKFGEGRIFSTRLVNALITDDGKVYVGAVTKDQLVKTADSAK
ncbi:sigma-E factor regulatory protein RseB domain-containing protein [Streptomyces sp. M-16]|uniref:LolA family protein n=1 Tax=Streptomyces sp. M-16 TaxID=3233040 RepID=UPI00225554F4